MHEGQAAAMTDAIRESLTQLGQRTQRLQGCAARAEDAVNEGQRLGIDLVCIRDTQALAVEGKGRDCFGTP